MKVVVVNDCAYVMADLIPYLESDFDIEFIQRSRGLWSKTFGILWKIIRAKGDVFHVNYALQDAYLVDKFKHLDVLHVHGSDVRWTIHSKKYGWIVKHNLEHAKKVVYATPDLEQIVKKFRSDAIYLPTPVKTKVFTTKNNYNNYPRAVYFKLAYEELPIELMKALAKNGISLTILDRTIPYEKMPETLRAFDIYIDRFTIPSFSKTCLEAMSCGLATVTYEHRSILEQRVRELSNVTNLKNIGVLNRWIVKEKYDAPKIAEQLSKIWKEML